MTDNPRQNVTFPSNGGTAHGYLAGSDGPGVVVIQEWWGLTDHIADIADRLAAEGFVALAPDLYGGKTTHDAGEAGALMTALPVDQAARDLAGAVDCLLGRTGRRQVGAIGFCMGGGFVLLLAAQQGDKVAAAVPFYGVGPAMPSTYTGLSAAVQGHYAEHDDFYPVEQARAQADQIRAESGADVTFHFYDAGHAFHNDTDPIGTYSQPHAELAWTRAVAFLRNQLR